MLSEGTQAPEFSLPNEAGEQISLSSLKGQKVVLYFYPKDDTPGCTKEACGFRDNYKLFTSKGAVVVGISADGEQSHAKFKEKYELPFHLLADPEKQAINAYGAWGEKTMYGKTYEGVMRYTYIIDENGVISHVFPKVKPEEHALEVLKAIS